VRGRAGILVAAILFVALLAGAAISVKRASGDSADAKPHHGGGLHLATVGKFDQPTFVGAPRNGGDVAYVTERPGRIRLLRGTKKLGTFLDMRRWVGCCELETGLFSVAFPPDYARSGRFYVYFTNRHDDIEVDEFRRSKGNHLRALASSRRKIIEIDQRGDVNHNGGQVAFGPDGLLYLATGDGGNFEDPSEQSQKKGSLLGKLLRIDPRAGRGRRAYAIPPSNPYAHRGGRGEIYARGLRNPFRFSFDRGRILIGDVGQDTREEVDIEKAKRARGANFGWSVFEGTKRFRHGHLKRHDKPAFQYPHKGGACSIVGGYVIRDPHLPRLDGRYVYGDYCSGEIRSFRPTKRGARGDRSLGVGAHPGVVSFGTDARKRLYVVELESGRVMRLSG
jgi:glucose/arabinose dehydrogenase